LLFTILARAKHKRIKNQNDEDLSNQ
jgi:hypothetical protein